MNSIKCPRLIQNELRNQFSQLKLRYLIYMLFCSVAFVSCKEEEVIDEDVLVSVFDRSLTYKEMREIIPLDASSSDSSFIADRYVDNWIKEQILLVNAEHKLPEEKMNFEKELENHRNTLLSYTYEKAIVDQNLDTLVQHSEIEEYYEKNKSNFVLKDFIVQVQFCILDEETKDQRKFNKLFYSKEVEDLVTLEQFCVNNNVSYYLKSEEWLYFDELKEQIPLEVYNTERFLKKNSKVEFVKDKKLYFLKILDYKLKDGLSPLSLQEENIKQIILNKRKSTLIQTMKDDLYNQALKEGEIIWHKE